MTNEEAQEVAGYARDLWGVDRGDVWLAFFATEISALGYAEAMRALRRLFATEQFLPTPNMLVETARGTTNDLADAAFGELRRAIVRNEDPGIVARRAAAEVYGTLSGVPLDTAPTRMQFEAWRGAWKRHTEAAAVESLSAITTGVRETHAIEG